MSSAPDQSLAPAAALDASGRSFVAFARWSSALIVMLSHLRAIMFIGWGELASQDRNILVIALYLCTAFYHEAVIIFFVLSGFLIAGPNIDRARVHAFSAVSYGIDRFTRIYVTAIPALLLTAGADAAGRTYMPWTGFFDGSNSFVRSRFPNAFQSDSARALFGNMLMLQPIHVPVLGSNVPLWSLSYEVWFYVWFGTIAFAMQRKRCPWLLVVITTLGLCLFHWSALFFLGIWCFGALAYQWGGWHRSIGLAALCFALSLGLSLSGKSTIGSLPLKPTDLIVGMSFAWLLALMKRRSYRTWIRTERFNQALSNFSYSLYTIHFPTILLLLPFFLATAGVAGALKHGYIPNGVTLAIYVATAVSTFFAAFLFSRLFEARTASVRRLMKSMF